MPAVIPDEVPVRFAAGTTVKFHRSFDDFLASEGWTYKFHANGPTTRLDVAATTNADGQSFDIVIPADVSSLTTPTIASLPAGRYQWAERLTNTNTHEVVDPNLDSLQLVVEADVSTASAGAFISHIERSLPIIEAAIEGRLTADIETYTLAGRMVSKIPIKELLVLRGHYRAKLFQLKNPGRLGSPVVVAFTNEPEQPTFPPTWVDVTGLDR
jgi:hypothetical protein